MATMRPHPRPLTAKVTMEIVYDDKSKELIETSELDLTAVPHHGGYDEDPHFKLGVETPWERIGMSPYSSLVARVPPPSELTIDLRLPAKDGNKYLYKSTKIEAPATNVVMIFNSERPCVCNFDEKKAAEKAESFGTSGPYAPIYFLLDIP